MDEKTKKAMDDVVLTPDEETLALEASSVGEMLAQNWLNTAEVFRGMLGINVTTPALVHACAQVFAFLIMMSDKRITTFEQEGLGLIGDDERIAVFVEEVKERAATLRMQRAESEAKVEGKLQEEKPTGKRRSKSRSH